MVGFPASLAIIPIGTVFFVSGLIVNLLQAIVFILIRPVSKNLYRRVNKFVVELLWLQLVWLIDWWSNVNVKVYGDDETIQLMGKEHALVLCNHRSDIDWLIGWLLAQHSGCLGTAIAIMKKEAKSLPIIGWSMWFSDYLFLERSWAKDQSTLQLGYKRLEDFPVPFWLALFVEGTRFTQAKLQQAQEYAASKGLPIPRNTLLPRTKGFVSAVTNMRSFVPAIYDCTVAVPNNQPAPTLLRIFRRQPCMINVQVKRYPMNELPETVDGIAQWCKDLFVTKDAMLEKFLSRGILSDQKLQDWGRSKRSFFVVIFWSSLLIYGIVRLCQYLSNQGLWEVIAFSATLFVLVIIVMQILIHSSESEHSAPRHTAPPSDPITTGLLHN